LRDNRDAEPFAGAEPGSLAGLAFTAVIPVRAGQVGDKFTVTAGEAKYDVTLLRVDQPAQPADDYSSAQPGHHLAAAQFRVTAITSTDENANNNATVTGSDEQAYVSSVLPVAAGDLGGKNTSSSYSSFVAGFKTTEMVSVQILDLSGDIGTAVVTARLTTLETDGSTKVFEGTYTVKNGVIAKFDVHQVS
jgi:hypothetical protein